MRSNQEGDRVQNDRTLNWKNTTWRHVVRYFIGGESFNDMKREDAEKLYK